MKLSHTILAIAITASGLSTGAYASSDRAPAQTEGWLSIPAVHDKLTADGYSDIYEIGRERDGYEVKTRNADGDQVKLYIDPITGEIVKTRSKGE